MGLRFRKSVSFGRFVRLNFSGSGMSLGLGPRGANINISKRGVRQTFGVPGTGLSYQTFSKRPVNPTPTQQTFPPPVSNARLPASNLATAGRPQGSGFVVLLIVVGVITGLYLLLRAPAPSPAAVGPTSAVPSAPGPSPAAAAQTVTPLEAERPAAQAPDIRPLALEEVREAQTRLKAFSLDPGPLDGLPGSLTAAAVKKYEAARQRPITGILDRPLLERLRQDAGGAVR